MALQEQKNKKGCRNYCFHCTKGTLKDKKQLRRSQSMLKQSPLLFSQRSAAGFADYPASVPATSATLFHTLKTFL